MILTQFFQPRLVPALLLGLLLAATGCHRSRPEKVTVDGLRAVQLQMDWFPQTEYGGYYQALARGYYREAGLQVTLVPGGPGVPVKDIVALGRVAFGMTDGNDVLVAISRGLPLVIVGAEMQHNPQGILFHTEHPLHSFRELDGKTIMAGTASAWVEYLQRKLGIKFGLVPLTEDLTSFLHDETSIRQCFVTQEPYFVQQKGAHPGTLLIADSGYDPYRVIYTSREYWARNPEVVKAFVAATVRGYREFLEGDPAPAYAALAAANPLMTPDVMQYSRGAMQSLRLVSGDAAKGETYGRITRERLRGQLAILQQLGLTARVLTPEEVAVFDGQPPAALVPADAPPEKTQ